MTSSVKPERAFPAILLASLLGSASASKPVSEQRADDASEPAPAQENDEIIIARVKKAILGEPSLQSEKIGVEDTNGEWQKPINPGDVINRVKKCAGLSRLMARNLLAAETPEYI